MSLVVDEDGGGKLDVFLLNVSCNLLYVVALIGWSVVHSDDKIWGLVSVHVLFD